MVVNANDKYPNPARTDTKMNYTQQFQSNNENSQNSQNIDKRNVITESKRLKLFFRDYIQIRIIKASRTIVETDKIFTLSEGCIRN